MTTEEAIVAEKRAAIIETKSRAIGQLVSAQCFTPASVVEAVESEDLTLLAAK